MSQVILDPKALARAMSARAQAFRAAARARPGFLLGEVVPAEREGQGNSPARRGRASSGQQAHASIRTPNSPPRWPCFASGWSSESSSSLRPAQGESVALKVTLKCGRSRFRTCDPCRVKAVLYR
jgi:hypothetical protein